MKIEYQHGVSAAEAFSKIDGLLAALQTKYQDRIRNPQKNWNDTHDRMTFSLEVQGQRISGNLELRVDRAILDIKLPFLARFLSSRIQEMMREKLDELFFPRSR